MIFKTLPWEFHGDLTEDRLVTVARLIADGRQTAVELFDAEAGDDGWTLGCRAFQFGRARILRAADSEDYPWLGAIDRTLGLIFTIGEVPVRIYRGDGDEPTDRTLRQSFGELEQLGFSFGDADEGRNLAYRYAVETDLDGSVLAIKFVGLRGQTAVLNWTVPIETTARTGAVARPATESVDLDAPAVGTRGKASRVAE